MNIEVECSHCGKKSKISFSDIAGIMGRMGRGIPKAITESERERRRQAAIHAGKVKLAKKR